MNEIEEKKLIILISELITTLHNLNLTLDNLLTLIKILSETTSSFKKPTRASIIRTLFPHILPDKDQ